MLRQPDDEVAQAEKKALAVDALQNLNLQTVFLLLTHADWAQHQVALQGIIDESKDDLQADLYGKSNALPLDVWLPYKMTNKGNLTYTQMLEMTEAVLRDFCNWIYQHYGLQVTAIQVCIIML